MASALPDKRDDLMRRKMDVDEALSKAKIELDEAKGLAWSEGRFLPPREYAAMRQNVARLQRDSQRLQFELRGDRKAIHKGADQKGAAFLQEFLLVARRRLAREQYLALCKEAESALVSTHPATPAPRLRA